MTQQTLRVAPSLSDLGINDVYDEIATTRGLVIVAWRDAQYREEVIAAVVQEYLADGMKQGLMIGGTPYDFPALGDDGKSPLVLYRVIPDDLFHPYDFFDRVLRPAPDVVTIDTLDIDEKKLFARNVGWSDFVLTTIAADNLDAAVAFMSEYSEQYPMEDEPAKLVFFHDTDSDTAPEYTIVE